MSDLPAGWTYAIGSDLFRTIRGVTYRGEDSSPDERKGHVPLLRATNIQRSRITLDDLVWIPETQVSADQWLRPGDILLTTSSGSLGVVGKAASIDQSLSQRRFTFGAFCAVLRPHDGTESTWLALFVRTAAYREWVRARAAGININNLRASDLPRIRIPLPPLAEQRRIIGRVERLLRHSDLARNELLRIPLLVTRFKGALLNSAFRSDSNEKWPERSFFDVLDFKGGNQPPKASFSSEPRPGYIRLLQIRDFASDDRAVYINDNGRWPRCEKADILVGRYGASVGKVLSGKAGAYNVALVKMLYDSRDVDPRFLYFWLQDRPFQECVLGVSRSAQNGFNKGDLERLPIRIPRIEEQINIAMRLTVALSTVDHCATESLRALTLSSRLDEEVLDAAFRGDIVPEERDGEYLATTLSVSRIGSIIPEAAVPAAAS